MFVITRRTKLFLIRKCGSDASFLKYRQAKLVSFISLICQMDPAAHQSFDDRRDADLHELEVHHGYSLESTNLATTHYRHPGLTDLGKYHRRMFGLMGLGIYPISQCRCYTPAGLPRS